MSGLHDSHDDQGFVLLVELYGTFHFNVYGI